MLQHVDVDASYTLASATGDVGSAYDELELNLVQDITDPLAPVQNGPQARTDARHRVTVSAIVELRSASRRSSRITRRCRSTPSKASI